MSALAGSVLVLAMIQALLFLCQLTCCWRRTVRKARKKADRAPWRHVSRAKTTLKAVWRSLNYLRKPPSAHYIQLLFLLEAKEFVVQALAVEQMSRSGIRRIALTLYTTIILANGFTPLVMWWVINRVNRIDDPVARRAKASKMVARLLLFDATCDLSYTAFGLAHVLIRYQQLFGQGDNSRNATKELMIINRYRDSALANKIHPIGVNDLKAFLLLSEAKNTLFGATSYGDIAIKVMARVIPLLQAPFRVMSAFRVRQSLTAGDDHDPAGEAKAARAAAAAAIQRTLSDRAQSMERGGRGSNSVARHYAVLLVQRSAFKGRYNAVPFWAASALFVASLSFCLFVYVRLWTWGDCKIPEINDICAVRAYPIFDTFGAHDCHNCACNTLLYARSDCPPTGVGSTNGTQGGAEVHVGVLPSGGCRALYGQQGDRRNRSLLASEVLNSSPAILKPASTILVHACQSDVALLATLGERAHWPSILELGFGRMTKTKLPKAWALQQSSCQRGRSLRDLVSRRGATISKCGLLTS